MRHQRPDGFWHSYWWRGLHFTTSRCISALWRARADGATGSAERAVRWALMSQAPAGFWDNGVDTGEPCVLSTALCATSLIAIGLIGPAVCRAIEWLTSAQLEDGSWVTCPSLQIPPPAVLAPESDTGWQVGGRGVGACCADGKRIYTTATALKTLSSFIQRVDDGL